MPRYRNLVGETFGRLTVLKEAEPTLRPNGKPRRKWLCRCECGNELVVFGENLTRNNTNSCGCLKRDTLSNMRRSHGDADSRLYGVWCAMKRRCYNENVPEYKWYGARGIAICDDWLRDYSAFKEWAMANGYNPDAARGECTIDRIDCNGNYSPQNCRWVSQLEQMNNIRTNHVIEYNGERHTLAEWSRIVHIPAAKILQRITRYNWSPEKALTTN